MPEAEKSFTRKAVESLVLKLIVFIVAAVGTVVLTWYTANSAWVHGRPGYKVGLIVAAVLALCGIATYFFILAIARVPLRNAPAGSLLEPQGSWLDEIAEKDRLELDEFVYVARCKLTMVLDGDSPHLFFNFYVINCAVYAVTFDPVFEGIISYAGRKLEGQTISDNTYIARNLPHGWNTDFYLRQELSRTEADFIANDPNPKAHHFSFRNLRITVRGDSTHRTVPPTTLKINYVLRDGSVNIL